MGDVLCRRPLNETPLTVKVDRAQANVIALPTIKKLLPELEVVNSNVILSAYGGSRIPVIGSVIPVIGSVIYHIRKLYFFPYFSKSLFSRDGE